MGEFGEGDHEHAHEGIPHRDGAIKVEGFGVSLRIQAGKVISAQELELALKELVTSIAEGCLEKGAKTIGHIKSHLKASSGYIKADIVHLSQGAFAQCTLRNGEKEGELVINSIVLGLSRNEIERITLRTAEKVLRAHGFSMTTVNQGDEMGT